MKITGMEQINRKRRRQSKKNAKNFSRKKENQPKPKKKTTNIKFFESSRRREYTILITSFLILLFGYLIFSNWRGITDLLDALEIVNPVIDDVISDSRENDDGIERIILVTTKYSQQGDVDIEKVYSLTHNREKGVRSIVHIPGQVYIPLSYKEFSERSSVSNLYYAGETISSDLGTSYAIWEIGNLLGVKYDSFIWLQPEATAMFKEDTGVGEDEDSDKYLNKLLSISNPINLLLKKSDLTSMSNHIYSDLDGQSIMNILSKYNFSGFDEVEYLDLGDSEFTEMEVIASGDEVPFLQYSELDPKLKELALTVISKDVEREQAKVEVYNGSEISGQASRYARDIQNNGIKVVRVDNTDVVYEKTTIFVPLKEEFENSLSLVLSFFPAQPQVKEQRPDFLTTADIIVVLGEDLQENVEWLPDL